MRYVKQIAGAALAAALFCAPLAGCGQREGAAQQFFTLWDQMRGGADWRYDLKAEGTGDSSSALALEGDWLGSWGQYSAQGSLTRSGKEIAIPALLLEGSVLYLDGKDLSGLASLALGSYGGLAALLFQDSWLTADLSGGVGEESFTQGAGELLSLLSAVGERGRTHLLQTEDAFSGPEEEGYTLTLEGEELRSCLALLCRALGEGKEGCLKAVQAMGPFAQALLPRLEEGFDALEALLPALESGEGLPDDAKFTLNLRQEGKAYHLSAWLWAGESLSLELTVTPLERPEELEIPTQATDLTRLLLGRLETAG